MKLGLATNMDLLLGLSICVKYATDTIGRPIIEYYKLPKSLLRVVALGVGIGFAFGVRVPLVDNGLMPWASTLLTGILIGGGGGLIHDVVKAISYVKTQGTKLGR